MCMLPTHHKEDQCPTANQWSNLSSRWTKTSYIYWYPSHCQILQQQYSQLSEPCHLQNHHQHHPGNNTSGLASVHPKAGDIPIKNIKKSLIKSWIILWAFFYNWALCLWQEAAQWCQYHCNTTSHVHFHCDLEQRKTKVRRLSLIMYVFITSICVWCGLSCICLSPSDCQWRSISPEDSANKLELHWYWKSHSLLH